MSANETHRELEALRARVATLERENEEQARRTNAAIAAAQERSYWLDRWHLDLNRLMRRRGAAEFRAAVRAARTVTRGYKKGRRRVREALERR